MRSTKPMMLATAFVILFAIVGTSSASAACDFNCFAGADGDQISNTAGLTDWQDIADAVNAMTDPVKGSDPKFGGGDKETKPGDWNFITGNNTPKTDILEGWSSLTGNNLDVAFVRAKQTGDAFLAFELNRHGADLRADGQYYAHRTTGDLLFTYDIPTTNTVSFGLCTWDGNEVAGVWRKLDGTAVGGPVKQCTKLSSSGLPPIAEG